MPADRLQDGSQLPAPGSQLDNSAFVGAEPGAGSREPGASRTAHLAAVWIYFGLLILLPVGWMLREILKSGLKPLAAQIATPGALHAFMLSGLAAFAAVTLNTVFGLIAAIVLVRQRFWYRGLLNAIVDLPFAVSPVIAGYMLMLLYGRQGWFGPWLERLGIPVAYALPGIILATASISLPFVIREVAPVLEEAGTEQEDAARTLGAGPFRVLFRVTLPSVRWGLLYGVTLTLARALGEFGAVLVISGNVMLKTQTATLYVYQEHLSYNEPGALGASFILAAASFGILLLSEQFRRKAERVHGHPG